MATIKITHVDEKSVSRLMDICHYAHIEFANKALYYKAINLGFNKDIWEYKNREFGNNKVKVKQMEQTLGEQRVRVNFNPSEEDLVDRIKVKSAELIDLMQGVKNDEVSKTYESSPSQLQATSGEKLRLIALAQTAYEEAAMWAVKAATY